MHVAGLPGYFFSWDLLLDSENAEEGIKTLFDSPPVLMETCQKQWR